jgi:hypothetical protein
MHDLDRSDLVFESGGFEEGLEEFDEDIGADEMSDDDEVFDDSGEELELASELLAVADDEELDQFLGKFIKKRLRPFSRKLAGNLGGFLKGAVKKVLPTVASMAGGAIGGPAGAMIASNASPYLSNLLGMELEGLSPEDQELEAAKSLVRMAGSAIENAANLAMSSPAASAAKQAVIDAARRHVPGLVRNNGARSSTGAQQGTWYRRGNRIVIVGV